MSGLEDILGGALGGDVVAKLAGQLGTDEAGARSAIGVALPKLLGQLHANAQTEDGANALAAAVNKDHDGSLLDDLRAQLDSGAAQATGSKVLGKVFGGQQDAAVQAVAQQAGLDPAKAAGLLGSLAPIVLGALGKMGSTSGGVQAGGLSSILGGLLGGGSGGLAGMLGGLLGGGGSAASGAGASGAMGKVTDMLDRNNDGSVVDDVQKLAGNGMVKKLLGMFRKR